VARGVAVSFLHLLHADRRAAVWRLMLCAVLVAGVLAAGWFVAPLALAVAGGAALLGAVAGFLLGGSTYAGRFTRSLSEAWEEWMAKARPDLTAPRLARLVAGRTAAPRWLVAVAWIVGLCLVESVLWWWALRDGLDLASAAPALGANAVLWAFLVAWQARALHWTRTLRASLDEMVRDGEVRVVQA
jgi:hypothetical protein